MELIVGKEYTFRNGEKDICTLDSALDFYFKQVNRTFFTGDYKDGVWWYNKAEGPEPYDILLADQIDLDTLLKEADEVLEEYYNRPFVLEEGVVYLTRSGEVTTPLSHPDSDSYFETSVCGIPWYYAQESTDANGSFLIFEMSKNDKDLVSYAKKGVDY